MQDIMQVHISHGNNPQLTGLCLARRKNLFRNIISFFSRIFMRINFIDVPK